ncbi:MAG: NifB/NifX family molybdenum-iron cluster-binding protein [Planctomycetota bacterium]
MTVCVTSKGPDLSSEVDPRFGRARFFIIHDGETGEYEVIDNEQNMNAAGGAGVQSATTIADRGCDWVISGHMGPKAMSVLQEAGIRVATGAEGKVSDALQAFKNGELEEADDADVPSHW